MDVLKQIREEVKISNKETSEVKKKINSFISKIKVKDAKVILGGSGAKGTWLKDAHDADIFVLFNYNKYKNRSDKLSDILEKSLKKFSYERIHGSRDYFQVKDKNFTFEIVPILEIKNSQEAINITDVSPLHAKWVLKKANKNVKEEIKVLKKFLRSNNLYGAESYIKGISGYIVEILTIHYKSFKGVMKAVSKWKDKVVIDPSKYYKTQREVIFNINKSKQQCPVIIVDPVDKSRNAAAALGEEKFEEFKKLAKKFLKKESIEMFRRKDNTIESIKKKKGKNKALVLELKPKKGKIDVIGSKILKVIEILEKEFVDYGFIVKKVNWEWDKENPALAWFYIDSNNLKKSYTREGPPLTMEKHVKNFKKINKNTTVKKGKIYAKINRDHVKIEDFMKVAIKNKRIKENIKAIKASFV